jgi:hypothetical protein
MGSCELNSKGCIKTGAKYATPISSEGKRYLTLALCVSLLLSKTTNLETTRFKFS